MGTCQIFDLGKANMSDSACLPDYHRFATERRSTERFPLQLHGELSTAKVQFTTQTINVSGGGLLVTCDREIAIGTMVTIRLHWPVKQAGKPVTLVVHGEIVRKEPSQIAILRHEYDFEAC